MDNSSGAFPKQAFLENFLNFLSTWASGIDILLFLKSNDPTVITRDYDTF